MTESEYKGSDNEVIDAYYDIYMYHLNEELMSLEECQWDLEMLEEEEEYLACAGIFKAINNYKAIKEERFSDLWLGLNVNTD